MHPEPGLEPLSLLRADRRRWLDDHNSGHIEQTGRDAQPQLTRMWHHHGSIEINSELGRRL